MSVDKWKRKRGIHVTREQGSALGRKEAPVALDHVEEPAGVDPKRNKPGRKDEHGAISLTHRLKTAQSAVAESARVVARGWAEAEAGRRGPRGTKFQVRKVNGSQRPQQSDGNTINTAVYA